MGREGEDSLQRDPASASGAPAVSVDKPPLSRKDDGWTGRAMSVASEVENSKVDGGAGASHPDEFASERDKLVRQNLTKKMSRAQPAGWFRPAGVLAQNARADKNLNRGQAGGGGDEKQRKINKFKSFITKFFL